MCKQLAPGFGVISSENEERQFNAHGLTRNCETYAILWMLGAVCALGCAFVVALSFASLAIWAQSRAALNAWVKAPCDSLWSHRGQVFKVSKRADNRVTVAGVFASAQQSFEVRVLSVEEFCALARVGAWRRVG